MEEFLAVALALPTAFFSIPLAVMTLYWLTVIVGVLDVPGIDAGSALAGKAEALPEVAGALAGKTELLLAQTEGSLAAFLSVFRMRNVPLTVVLTLLLLVGFLLSFAASLYVLPTLAIPSGLAIFGVTLASLALAWPVAAAASVPLAPIFRVREGVRHSELIGHRVVVVTSRVTETFGEGELADGGAGLLLQIRCPTPNTLTRGQEALLVVWDPSAHAFDVTPMTDVLADSANG